MSIVSAVYHSIISTDPEHLTASSEVLLKKYPVNLAFTNELCAGIVDKSKSLIEIAKEEILEECGYNVPIERIELVMTYRHVEIVKIFLIVSRCVIICKTFVLFAFS